MPLRLFPQNTDDCTHSSTGTSQHCYRCRIWRCHNHLICNVLRSRNDHHAPLPLLWQQAVCRCGRNNGSVGLRRNWTRNRWQMCQEHNPTDDRRDAATPKSVPHVVRADTLARQFDRLQGSRQQQSDCFVLSVHALDRKSGKPEPAPKNKSGP